MVPKNYFFWTIIIFSENTLPDPNLEDDPQYLEQLEHLQGGDARPETIHGLPENLKEKEMRFSPPKLSDEEERSPHMPAYLLCDGCVAVATQIQKAFHVAHRHTSMDRDLPIWDVIETIENTCEYDTFTDYGITDADDKHRLKGPGLDPTVGKGGISHMGGKWPGRLANICSEMVGVYEDHEMELYKTWKEQKDYNLVDFLCWNVNRPEFGKCLNEEEQGELVRDEIEDMIKTMTNKNEEL